MNLQHKYFFIIVLFSAFQLTIAQIEKSSFEFEGKSRDYIVFLPQNFQPNMPVVFNLHGYNYTAMEHMNNTLMNEVADTMGFLVVYPNAIPPGFSTGLSLRAGWPPLPDVNDIGFISSLIDTVSAKYEIDLTRVYCCGLSNGAFMTIKLAFQLRNKFAAGATIAGVMLDTLEAHSGGMNLFPILMCHGTADLLQPYDGDITFSKWSVEETLSFWIQTNRCSLEGDTTSLPDVNLTDGCTVDKMTYKDSSNSVDVVFYKVNNGGHNWPSGKFMNQFVGNTNRDINANVEILNFFKNHSLQTVRVEGIKRILSKHYDLAQNYPNPFNPSTTLKYEIPKESYINLKVYDILGREVATLVNEQQKAGYYEVEFDATDLTSGIYFYRIKAGDFVEVKKMVLMK